MKTGPQLWFRLRASLDRRRSRPALFFLMLCFAAAAPAAPPTSAGYLDCARGMGVAIDERFAVLTGDRLGGRGVYIYTGNGAWFVPFEGVLRQDADMQEYALLTRLADIGDLFLNVRETRAATKAGVQPAVNSQTEGFPRDMSYTPAFAVLDDRARLTLSQVLKKRISGIKDFIDDKNRYSTPEQAQRAFEQDRAAYLKKLESCRLDGDADLLSVVTEEERKLREGHPGVTIWETQVQAKRAFAVPTASSVR